MKSAVLFLIFKREDTTRMVFKKIREAQPPRLYIAADGPRHGRPGEKEQCYAARKVVEIIDWPCEVHRLYRDENHGCGKAVSEAISWFFEHEKEGIIIEDDVLPHIDFFEFCDEMLERYRDRLDIHSIGGHCALKNYVPSDASYYKSTIMEIWGWATWKRVWDTYEYDANKYSRKKLVHQIWKRYPAAMAIFNLWALWKVTKKNAIDTWDYQFGFNMIYHKRYTISPYHNLVQNVGFGTGATHTSESRDKNNEEVVYGILPIKHPLQLSLDRKADIVAMSAKGMYNHNLLFYLTRSLFRVVKRRYENRNTHCSQL